MKRIAVLLLLALLPLVTGCSANETKLNAQSDIDTNQYDLSIKEKLFLAQVNDVYINARDFLGKSIHLEGMFSSFYYEPTDSIFCMVYRYGPGCCGTDGTVGFEITWAEDADIAQPEENAWIEVAGILEEYEAFGANYLRLNLSKMQVKADRGAETVLQ